MALSTPKNMFQAESNIILLEKMSKGILKKYRTPRKPRKKGIFFISLQNGFCCFVIV
jgi:hypothetical protein